MENPRKSLLRLVRNKRSGFQRPFRFGKSRNGYCSQHPRDLVGDSDSAKTIVSAEQLAEALGTTSAQIYALTRLGVLHPVERDLIRGLHRYELLESTSAYLRHFRARSR